ncbi:hypothetical protein [Chryseolinea lacunae]|uniref:Tetratricopeptide repeat protein n=1 Tax=Chryseolinea lacunae TaxID=2801331 RepID=A0ABS1KWT9_9BACT|nr:hypothetical protein [Chryseolinea lacunae]MBL0743920.1 hypothetical protein [Chryseolinea lacunae]
MLGFYTPVLILQAFCLYHAYRNGSEQRWYWMIVFFSFLGCGLYLYHNFYNRRSLQTISESVKVVANSNYKIEQLEKAVRFNDNLANKIRLADAYVHIGRPKDAIALYGDCLTGFMADDPLLRMKLLQAHFTDGNLDEVIQIGDSLAGEKTFRDAHERIAYAWALHQRGNTARAQEEFESMDRTFTNYEHRHEYCKFLQATNQPEALNTKLSELLEEINHMSGTERRLKRDTIRQIRDMNSTV